MSTDQATAELTERQREILGLLAAGYTNPEISARLFVAPETVKSHLRRMFAALEVANRAEAVSAGYRLGLMPDRLPTRERGPRPPAAVRPEDLQAVIARWRGRAPAALLAELQGLAGRVPAAGPAAGRRAS